MSNDQYKMPKNLPSVIGIVGSRNFPRLDMVERLTKALPYDTLIVSGGAVGVDQTAETVAIERKMNRTIIPVSPQAWTKFGKSAGPRRNALLVEYVNVLGGMIFIFASTDNGVMTPGSTNVKELCEKKNVRFSLFEEMIYDL